jgi:hypothetical protein
MLNIDDDREKFGMIMCMHFPDVKLGNTEALQCKKCEDFKGGSCPGKGLHGEAVLVCMRSKVKNSIIEIHRSLVQ